MEGAHQKSDYSGLVHGYGEEKCCRTIDGKFLAVGSQNGTGFVPGSPFYHEHGVLQIFAVDGATLKLVDSAPIGRWSEGAAWTRNGKMILLQNDRDRTNSVFSLRQSGGQIGGLQ